MSRTFMYFPDSDTLEITLATGPVAETENAGVDGEHDNILFHYDDQQRLKSITIDTASKSVDLSNILQDQQNIISGGPSQIFTVSSLAQTWQISSRTLQKTIQRMSEAGLQIGTQLAPNSPIILTDADAQKIEQWRAKHRPGRPKTVEV